MGNGQGQLAQAAQNYDSIRIHQLLSKYTRIKDSTTGAMCLCAGVATEDGLLVRRLVTQLGVPVDVPQPAAGMQVSDATALHIAAALGKADMVLLLISLGADINVVPKKDPKNTSLAKKLIFPLGLGLLEVRHEATPLTIAARRENKVTHDLARLASTPQDAIEQMDPVDPEDTGFLDVIKVLLRQGAELTPHYDTQIELPKVFLAAIKKGDMELVNMLLQLKQAYPDLDVDSKDVHDIGG